ncbi:MULTISPECIES: metallophosphoesterase [unclassified Ensifer]|uniref:metallophosphoesterase n=1 Tax=unclassified Ensifer TaxID=2633371 RepID=UPI0008138125|nr:MULTISPECIES: metallophosphoesterase [unclassified Ensifer]OCP01289.1 phosphatase [Ensifer sp. LC14]OCP03181.1 phosphatase [Ensifer sp. LC11]OCP03551.1 phosphatase [Ensifer sp. LC13]OCP33964.1 phosphatase [Ensifer sp. LC499]
MKLWIVSDLHLEFGQPFIQLPPPDADVLVCAGDLLTRGIVPSIEWLATNIPSSMPVVFVAGNHEYYRAALQESVRDARLLRDRYPNIHFVENETVDIGDVRFVGATLWTDFRLNGGDPELAMAAAQSGMNDYKKIKLSKLPYRKFAPIHAYRKHHESRAFLKSALAESSARKTVALSHHAPSPRSIPPEFQGDPLSACYASDLEDLLVEGQPALWVHGHVHKRVDYRAGKTKVLANPRGYPGERTGFDPQLVIEI